MGILERTYAPEVGAEVDEVLISSDSHVIEPAGLWKENLPAALRERVPDLGGARRNDAPGGMDKWERVNEMARDGRQRRGAVSDARAEDARPRRPRPGGGVRQGLQRLAGGLLLGGPRPAHRSRVALDVPDRGGG